MATSRDETINAAAIRHRAGDFDEAEALYRDVLSTEPDHLNGLQLLGLLSHQRGRTVEAVALLERAIAVLERRGDRAPGHAVLYNNLGTALHAAGRGTEAAALYQRGLALDPNVGELHANLGNALLEQGNVKDAIASYEQARHVGHLPAERLRGLADALIDGGRPERAVTLCQWLVQAAPDDAEAHYLLGRAYADSSDNRGAIAALRRCIEIDPRHAAALYRLGAVLARVGLGELAVPVLESAVELRPDDAGFHTELGNVLQSLGQSERAFASFQSACRLRPLVTWPAVKRPPDFSVLLITSPGVANTPPEFLLRGNDYDRHFCALLPGMTPDVDLLRRHGDIVINLISDVDQGRDMLAMAADVIDRLGKRTINHPRRIFGTGRDAVTELLSGIALCRVPRSLRASRRELAAPRAATDLRGLAFPLLLRVAGTHGGDAFERIDHEDDIAAFLAAHAAEHFYVTAFADYRSPDGHFRKYRFVFTNDEILPYHLAIGNDWKVHHYTTEMDRHAWMQDEEKAFLEHPDQVFSPAHYAALAAIRAAVGLEFFGIDCSLDGDGNIVVFEVNASMLIHDDNADFPYKTKHCVRIKEAFEAMLTRTAREARAAAALRG